MMMKDTNEAKPKTKNLNLNLTGPEQTIQPRSDSLSPSPKPPDVDDFPRLRLNLPENLSFFLSFFLLKYPVCSPISPQTPHRCKAHSVQVGYGYKSSVGSVGPDNHVPPCWAGLDWTGGESYLPLTPGYSVDGGEEAAGAFCCCCCCCCGFTLFFLFLVHGVQVVAYELVHLEHVHPGLLEHRLHLLVAPYLPLVVRVLQLVALDVLP